LRRLLTVVDVYFLLAVDALGGSSHVDVDIFFVALLALAI
jgi:hypothetical protein